VTLDRCRNRLDWAKDHLKALDDELAPFREAYADPPITIKCHKGGEVRDYYIDEVPVIPDRIGLRVSDCLHHLRSTLDNLIYSAAIAAPGHLSSSQLGALNFPLTEHPNAFAAELSKGAIAPLPAGAQTIVEGFQPYQRGKDAPWDTLAVLRKLSNRDKHRTLSVTGWHLRWVGHISSSSIRGVRFEVPLKNGAHFFQLRVGQEDRDVDVDIDFTFIITVQDPAGVSGRPINYWLEDIYTRIDQQVIPALRPFLS